MGTVETELKSEFIAKGINQTLHRIYLQVKCKLEILTPFEDIAKDITNQILLTYYNLEGMESGSDTLNVVQ